MSKTILRLRMRQGGLRRDEHGFNTAAVIGLVVGLVISVLLSLALLPTVANSEYIAAQNSTIKNASRVPTSVPALLPLIVILTVVTIAVMPIGALLYMLRE